MYQGGSATKANLAVATVETSAKAGDRRRSRHLHRLRIGGRKISGRRRGDRRRGQGIGGAQDGGQGPEVVVQAVANCFGARRRVRPRQLGEVGHGVGNGHS